MLFVLCVDVSCLECRQDLFTVIQVICRDILFELVSWIQARTSVCKGLFMSWPSDVLFGGLTGKEEVGADVSTQSIEGGWSKKTLTWLPRCGGKATAVAFLQGQKGLPSSNLWWDIKPKKWQLPEFWSTHKQASPWPLFLKQTLRILSNSQVFRKSQPLW